jgi:hypothetical protein
VTVHLDHELAVALRYVCVALYGGAFLWLLARATRGWARYDRLMRDLNGSTLIILFAITQAYAEALAVDAPVTDGLRYIVMPLGAVGFLSFMWRSRGRDVSPPPRD